MTPVGKEQLLIFASLIGLIVLSGCGEAEPDVCGSLEVRNSIMMSISSDHNNALVNYAAKNSNAITAMVGETSVEAEQLTILENAKRDAIYSLDNTVLIKTRDRATHSVTCIGVLDVTVAETTAQKEIEFRVKQTPDGNMLVSVNPFLF